MIKPILVLALALTALPTFVRTEGPVGQPPPEFKATKWYNTAPLSLDDLKGKAVLLQVFRTWWGPCNAEVPELATRFEKEESKGLVIIGVTDEQVDVVDKWIVTKKKTGYPIVILDGQLEKLLGVPHFPFAGVLDPDGKISYAGDSAEAALKKSLKVAKPGSIWPKKLVPAAALLRSGKMGEAWTELQTVKAAGGLDDKEQKTLDKFTTFVTGASADVVKAAQELYKKDVVYSAVKKLEPIANSKPPLPSAEAAQKLLTEINALPTIANEMKGGEVYAAAFAKEEAQDYLSAVNGYKDVIKKFAGTKIAGAAQKRAANLVERGMPGYEPACEKCMEAKKACEKHAKPVKL